MTEVLLDSARQQYPYAPLLHQAPFEVVHIDSKFGKGAISTTHLKEGEVIYSDWPLVSMQASQSRPILLRSSPRLRCYPAKRRFDVVKIAFDVLNRQPHYYSRRPKVQFR